MLKVQYKIIPLVNVNKITLCLTKGGNLSFLTSDEEIPKNSTRNSYSRTEFSKNRQINMAALSISTNSYVLKVQDKN